MLIAGIDEVGRGCWAGMVMACAVIIDEQDVPDLVTDSKKLSPGKRQEAFSLLLPKVIWATGQASVDEIDTLNIRQATLLAMWRAVENLAVTPQKILVDGRDKIEWRGIVAQAVIDGDAHIPQISAASIMAKVVRDHWMETIACQHYPHYGFQNHKGYGTPEHKQALQLHGICALHRRSFRPIKEFL